MQTNAFRSGSVCVGERVRVCGGVCICVKRICKKSRWVETLLFEGVGSGGGNGRVLGSNYFRMCGNNSSIKRDINASEAEELRGGGTGKLGPLHKRQDYKEESEREKKGERRKKKATGSNGKRPSRSKFLSSVSKTTLTERENLENLNAGKKKIIRY